MCGDKDGIKKKKKEKHPLCNDDHGPGGKTKRKEGKEEEEKDEGAEEEEEEEKKQEEERGKGGDSFVRRMYQQRATHTHPLQGGRDVRAASARHWSVSLCWLLPLPHPVSSNYVRD